MATIAELKAEIKRLEIEERAAQRFANFMGLERLKANRGVMASIAREIGISAAAVSQWDRVPAERVLTVERLTGIPRGELRPDLYPDD